MPPAPVTTAVLALAGALLLVGCTSAGGDGAPETSASRSFSTPTPSGAASSGADAAPTPAPTSAAPRDPSDPAYTVTSAIMAQLSNIPAADLTSELVVIAVSPQLRQVADQYDVTTGIDVKGANVSLAVESDALRCTVTVADPPETKLGLACRKR